MAVGVNTMVTGSQSVHREASSRREALEAAILSRSATIGVADLNGKQREPIASFNLSTNVLVILLCFALLPLVFN